ncbi:hypothetical protein [Leptolyngbya sp. PCC 6406]|uniref:hypothetical protein n=1 Tax=Leptolyngbya sp. PCC 6406 TaxID=1173264 RepID=UPI0002AC1123|nr:hypothetical protein [Leptolyngbya sp. PCC 6406]
MDLENGDLENGDAVTIGFCRLSQFKALLVGLVVADAASHGVFRDPRLRPCPQAQQKDLQQEDSRQANFHQEDFLGLKEDLKNLKSLSWRQNLVMEAHWTIAIAQGLALATPPLQQGNSLEVIALVPTMLRHLDEPQVGAQVLAGRCSGEATAEFRAGVQGLYQGLRSHLTPNVHQFPLIPQSPWPPWDQAFTLFQASGGDFTLTLAQSLRQASDPVVPLLAALLSTGQRGLGTIPIPWRQAIDRGLNYRSNWGPDGGQTPPSSLQQRWHLQGEAEILDLATGLWQAWAGIISGGSDVCLPIPSRRS